MGLFHYYIPVEVKDKLVFVLYLQQLFVISNAQRKCCFILLDVVHYLSINLIHDNVGGFL